MRDTSERLLRLLSLLQRRRPWNADQLAVELQVTDRTIRRDVGRLRSLGYPVASTTGVDGGYALEPGAALPPVTLDPEEAVAVFVALRDASSAASATGDPERGAAARSALEKVVRVLPDRARAAVGAMTHHSTAVDVGRVIRRPDEPGSAPALDLLARACRSRRRVTCEYERADGRRGPMHLEPRHLVRTMDRWYLVAYALDSESWRTLRVDRMADVRATTVPSRPRPDPADDLDALVVDGIRARMQRVTGVVRVHAPAAEIAHWISPAWGTVTPDGPDRALIAGGADSHASMARWLLLIDRPITVIGPPELAAAFVAVAAEAARAGLAAAGSPASAPANLADA
ncbi:HTH domain protein [Clavibacter michiganensis]|uniref:HTH domain protein n=1 Tax=Clavibacter michiganensis TaxID=28447 RepID=A0A251YHU1_9MICO|nr:WYL domain-containing protein [Clavibacter michiganensis]OUE23840.1 HTH domain protein [Clavibacter michiganensis]